MKILGLEASFLQRFEKPSRRFVRHQIASQLIIQIPHYASPNHDGEWRHAHRPVSDIHFRGIGQALPVVAVYALAGYRLLPAIQKVYQMHRHFALSQTGIGCCASRSR